MATRSPIRLVPEMSARIGRSTKWVYQTADELGLEPHFLDISNRGPARRYFLPDEEEALIRAREDRKKTRA